MDRIERLEQRFEQRKKTLEKKLADLETNKIKTLERQRQHDIRFAKKTAGVPGHFAHGLNLYKLFWVFFICCFLGVVIETIFWFITTGEISERTGLVWGPFNLIYGIGAVLLTITLYRLREKSDRWILIGGSIIGGAFEYFCSWIQEVITGTISWNYSHMPFNLNGRINLLYCIFFGVLALVWVKELYPRISGWIEQKVSRIYGIALTWVAVVFMALNSLVSGAAVLRMSQRYEGIPATSSWQQLMDDHYPDERLDKIYPSMNRTD